MVLLPGCKLLSFQLFLDSWLRTTSEILIPFFNRTDLWWRLKTWKWEFSLNGMIYIFFKPCTLIKVLWQETQTKISHCVNFFFRHVFDERDVSKCWSRKLLASIKPISFVSRYVSMYQTKHSLCRSKSHSGYQSRAEMINGNMELLKFVGQCKCQWQKKTCNNRMKQCKVWQY